MDILNTTPDRIRHARPDSVGDISQLAIGQVVIEFTAVRDQEGLINQHLTYAAIVRGSACRILSNQPLDTPNAAGKFLPVERIPARTKSVEDEPPYISISDRGITGICDRMPGMGASHGLINVSEEPHPGNENLEVSTGLYINGSNSYDTLFTQGYMGISLDSDPRLSVLPKNFYLAAKIQ